MNRSFENRVLIAMCAMIAVNQLGFGGIVPVLPLFAQSFGVSVSAIGMAIAIYGLARFVVAVPGGRMADAWGRRPTLALGGLVTCAGNLWCAAADSYPEFLIARFVAGVGAGLSLTIGQVVLADITTPERRGRTMAIYQGTFLFAVGIGPFPGGLLAEAYGLAAPFVAFAAAGFIAGAVAWFAVGETRNLSAENSAVRPGQGLSVLVQMAMLRRQIGFVLVSLISLLNTVVRTGALFSIIPILASLRLDLSASVIGGGLAIGSICGLLATYPAGMLVDYFGRKAIIVPATFLTALSMVLFCVAPSLSWFMAACVFWGVASAVGGAAPAAYAADSAPAGMNAIAISSFRMVTDFGYVFGPIFLGFIADIHSPEAALIVSAVLLLAVGLVFMAKAPETYRRRQ